MTQARTSISRRSTGFLASRSLERRVPLRGILNNQLASCCIARLLVLATEDRQKPIIVYIDSSGGGASEAMSVISTMNGIHVPVATFCRGLIGAAAAVVAAHGLKGFRSADPAAHFSLRLQPEDLSANGGSAHGQQSYHKMLAQILSADCGRPEAEVLRWFAEGAQFTPQEAVQRGLIDSIARQPALPAAA
jgi:ATP-dependent Clp endopeptidase proteolytic subunit ClpP